jgi:putative Mn2+ efflux pump MntP
MIIYVLLISIGLCIDTFALATTCGLVLKRLPFLHLVKNALAFAVPQTLFLVAGWFGGVLVEGFITSIDHWLVLGILVGIGCKMIYDGWKNAKVCREDPSKRKRVNAHNFGIVLGLGFAASFDAFAVGVSFGLLDFAILEPALILFAVSIIIALTGLYLGCKFARIPEEDLAIIGGIILIGLGVAISV